MTATDYGAIRVLLPAPELESVNATLARINEGAVHEPFSAALRSFVNETGALIMSEARDFPELLALGYWMRRSGVERLMQAWSALHSKDVLLVPRGTALHFTPSNVDTLWAYSWVLSLLVGNRNIIRISSRSSEGSRVLLDVFRSTLAKYPDIATSTAVVQYERNDQVTRALASTADVRIIWGGDETINTLRAVPVPPHTRDVLFPDRSSISVLDANSYLDLTAGQRDELAEAFFRDAYWFDQMACSSPRMVIWLGTQRVPEASEDFYSRVHGVVQHRKFEPDVASAVGKINFAYRTAIDSGPAWIAQRGNGLLVIGYSDLPEDRSDFCGSGTFIHLCSDSLSGVSQWIVRSHQTMTYFGISDSELESFVRDLNGRGIDRLVPVGSATTFDPIWDGMDLLQEFSRKVRITRSPARFVI